MKKILLCAASFVSLFASDLEVLNVYVKENPPHSKNTAMFMDIKNNTKNDITLLKAETNLSDIAELHNNINEDGKMRMFQVPNITIKANSTTSLKPGGLHVMVFDLKQNITKDTKAELILYFDNNKSIEINDIEARKIVKNNATK